MNKQTIPALALTALLSSIPALSSSLESLDGALEGVLENTFQVLEEDRAHGYDNTVLQNWKIAQAYTLSRGNLLINDQEIPSYRLQRIFDTPCYFSDNSIRRPISGTILETTDTIGTLYGSADCAEFLESLHGESITFSYTRK